MMHLWKTRMCVCQRRLEGGAIGKQPHCNGSNGIHGTDINVVSVCLMCSIYSIPAITISLSSYSSSHQPPLVCVCVCQSKPQSPPRRGGEEDKEREVRGGSALLKTDNLSLPKEGRMSMSLQLWAQYCMPAATEELWIYCIYIAMEHDNTKRVVTFRAVAVTVLLPHQQSRVMKAVIFHVTVYSW